jgi:uncharacterized membrane protein
MKPVELTGPLGAAIFLTILAAVAATWVLAIAALVTAPRRRVPRWALGTLVAAGVLNGVGNWSRNAPWALWPLAAVMPLTVLALLILLHDVRRRLRRQPGPE